MKIDTQSSNQQAAAAGDTVQQVGVETRPKSYSRMHNLLPRAAHLRLEVKSMAVSAPAPHLLALINYYL